MMVTADFNRAGLNIRAGDEVRVRGLPVGKVKAIETDRKDFSARYVLAIEYASETEEMVEYRGHKDRLWKRNYGKLYEQLGLKILHTGWATGWDTTTYWLCEKQ